jgi:hypothetical protein
MYLLKLNIEQINLDILNNLSCKEIGKKYGYSSCAVSRFIKKSGLNFPTRKPLRKDLINQKFGKLTVKSFVHRNRDGVACWNCICECGNTIIRSSKQLKKPRTKIVSCRKCPIIIPVFIFNAIERQAKERNKEFNLSKEYLEQLLIEQNFKCKLSGLDIYVPKTSREVAEKNSASLDRIDSAKGYVVGNVQWTHKIINYMKLAMSDEELLYYCKKVVNHMERK